jgi:anti-sigma factor RsiW
MTKSQDCQELLPDIADYLDGEATDSICAEIERHMEACENCQVFLNTLKKTIELYQIHDEREGLSEEGRLRLYRSLRLDDLISDSSEAS